MNLEQVAESVCLAVLLAQYDYIAQPMQMVRNSTTGKLKLQPKVAFIQGDLIQKPIRITTEVKMRVLVEEVLQQQPISKEGLDHLRKVVTSGQLPSERKKQLRRMIHVVFVSSSSTPTLTPKRKGTPNGMRRLAMLKTMAHVPNAGLQRLTANKFRKLRTHF